MSVLSGISINLWSRRNLFYGTVAFALFVSLLGPARALSQDTHNWIGSGNATEFFHFNDNWIEGMPPGANDHARFGISFAFPITIQFENDHALDDLLILKSDYVFQGINFMDNTPTVLATGNVEINDDATVALKNGVNNRRFELSGERMFLTGALSIMEGSQVNFSEVIAGKQSTAATGTLLISGEYEGVPSTLQVNDLVIADDGYAQATIKDGAAVSVVGDTQLGLFSGAGDFYIQGDEQSTHPSRLTTGNLIVASPGVFDISGRSEVAVNTLGTFRNAGEQTLVRVSSPDASVDIADRLLLGGGEVRLEQGARLTSWYTTVQYAGTAVGQVSIESSAGNEPSIWRNLGDVELAGSGQFSDFGGSILIDGGIVEIGQTLKIFETGELVMASTKGVASHLVVNTIDNRDAGNIVFEGGTLSVDWLYGDLLNIGATLAPGDDANGRLPGRTVILGDYFHHPSAALSMDIGGAEVVAQHDLVEVGGVMIVDGDLQLTMQNGYEPSMSDEIVLVSAANIIGEFSNVGNGSRLATTDGSGSFQVNYGFASPYAAGRVVLSDYESGVFLLGDVNGDGAVNLLDAIPFVEALANGDFIAAADINQDGLLNLLDVGPFVTLLAG